MPFFDFILQYGLKISLLAIFLTSLWFYIKRSSREEDKTERGFRTLIIIAIAARILDAILKTIGQYYLWTKNPFTEVFLSSGIDSNAPGIFAQIPIFQESHGYFIFYVLTRFWFNTLIVFATAFLFFAFLEMLKKKRESFFDIGEIKLGTLAILLVGWPQVILFIPIVFLAVILVSIFRMMILKKQYTTLGYPFILSSAFIFLYGDFLESALNISTLKI